MSEPGPGAEQSNDTPSIARTTTRGVAWSAMASASDRVVSFVAQIVLGYLLLTEDFGVWGLANSVLLLANNFQRAGLQEVLVHRQQSFRIWANAGFWLSALLGLLGVAIVAGAAVPMGWIYQSELGDRTGDLVRIMLVIAALPLVNALGIVPMAKLYSEMRFGTTSLVFFCQNVGASIGFVALAAFGMGAMSFAITMLVVGVARLALVMVIARPPLKPDPQLRRWRYLIKDVRWVLGNSMTRWVRNHADVLLLGLFAPPSAVGIYKYARDMSRQVFQVVTLNIAGVLLPGLAKLKDDPDRQREAFAKAGKLIAYLGVPMSIGIAAIAGPAVVLFLDEAKWSGLAPVVQVLAVGVAFRLLNEPAESLMFASGRFKQQFMFSMGVVALFIGAVITGSVLASRSGAVPTELGAAIAVALFCMAIGPGQLCLAIGGLGGSKRGSVSLLARPIVLSLVSIAPWGVLNHVYPLSFGLHAEAAAGVQILLIVALSAASYGVLSVLLRLREVPELFDRVEDIAPARARALTNALRGIARLPRSNTA